MALERVGGADDDGATSIVIGRDGRVWIAGYAGADVAYRGLAGGASLGQRDVFVLGLDPAGAPRTLDRIGGVGVEGGNRVDDPSDVVITLSTDGAELAVVGTFTQTFTVAGVTQTYSGDGHEAGFAVLLPLR